MNNKDTKKQPSAQALSDDDLENVGGGWTPTTHGRFYLSKAERKKLKKLGCKLKKSNDGGDTVYSVYQNGTRIDDLSLLLPQ